MLRRPKQKGRKSDASSSCALWKAEFTTDSLDLDPLVIVRSNLLLELSGRPTSKLNFPTPQRRVEGRGAESVQ